MLIASLLCVYVDRDTNWKLPKGPLIVKQINFKSLIDLRKQNVL